MSAALAVIAMVILLLLKGFFSGSEIALVNADKVKLRVRAGQGHRGSEMVLKLFRRPEVLLGTTLVGTNIATVALVTTGSAILFTLSDRGDLYAFLLLTPVLLILGEIVPKSVYQQKSDALAPVIIYPLWGFSLLFAPVIFVFSRFARLAATLVGVRGSGRVGYVIREQIRAMVEMTEGAATLGVFDRTRIRHAMRFAHCTVGEAMIPISDLIAVERSRGTRHALAVMRKGGYSRLPVYAGKISNIIGIVTLTAWDIMDGEAKNRRLEDLTVAPHFVSPHQTIDQLLPVLHQRADRMAIVVDEFGSAVGALTLEDVLEQVVGPIDMGRWADTAVGKRLRKAEKVEDDAWDVDARLPISELNDLLDIDLPAKEFHTLGGMLTSRLRRIPAEGESVLESGFRFTATRVSERAVLDVRVERERGGP